MIPLLGLAPLLLLPPAASAFARCRSRRRAPVPLALVVCPRCYGTRAEPEARLALPAWTRMCRRCATRALRGERSEPRLLSPPPGPESPISWLEAEAPRAPQAGDAPARIS